MRLILAGNYKQYVDWCRTSGHSIRDPDLRYIWDIHTIIGLAGPIEVVRVGTYYERKDRGMIENCLAAIRAQYDT